MEKIFVNLNGQILDSGQPLILVTNRAFRYGDGLFETMRFQKGRVLFIRHHYDRLLEGMKLLRLHYDQTFTPEWIEQEVLRLSRSTRIFTSGRVRFSLYRSGAGLYGPQALGFDFLVELEKLDTPSYQLNEKGLLTDLYTDLELPRNALAPLKTANAIPYVMAAITRSEKGLDEMFLVNDLGGLVEGISTNIFLVKGGKVLTPSLAEGCTSGIMRKMVIQLLIDHRIELSEKHLPASSLLEAEEVFMTNALQGIIWVGAFRQRRYYNQLSKKLSLLLGELADKEYQTGNV